MSNPTQPGIYVAEVYFGWKILEWKDGCWQHPGGGIGKWTACEPVQWVGPLPERLGVDKPKPVQEYDL